MAVRRDEGHRRWGKHPHDAARRLSGWQHASAAERAGKAVDSPIPGWEFALKAYLAIQKSDGQFKLDELEALKKQQAKGRASKLAKQALQKP